MLSPDQVSGVGEVIARVLLGEVVIESREGKNMGDEAWVKYREFLSDALSVLYLRPQIFVNNSRGMITSSLCSGSVANVILSIFDKLSKIAGGENVIIGGFDYADFEGQEYMNLFGNVLYFLDPDAYGSEDCSAGDYMFYASNGGTALFHGV